MISYTLRTGDCSTQDDVFGKKWSARASLTVCRRIAAEESAAPNLTKPRGKKVQPICNSHLDLMHEFIEFNDLHHTASMHPEAQH